MCGSSWFELRGAPEAGVRTYGAVAVDGHGAVIGYAGQLRCLECGEDWRPGTPHLQLLVRPGTIGDGDDPER